MTDGDPFWQHPQSVLRLSIIVPYHRNRSHLQRCLEGLRRAVSALGRGQLDALIVVADGATEDVRDLVCRDAREYIVAIPGPRGPATARNRAAELAAGDVLVFVDSDVVVHEDALQRLAARFESDRDLGAVFGAYDDKAADAGFISQGRNLAHSYVHQRSHGEARTFWAGLGAVRASLFAAVGGFDERFTRPSVEDIDLGYRLHAAGVRILLDPQVQATHLKRWTFMAGLVTDIRDRGIPWTQLLPRYGGLHGDLNLTITGRLCVVAAWGLAVSIASAMWWRAALVPAAASILILWGLEWGFYAFLARRRGWWGAAGYFPVQVVHHLGNGLAFAIGTLLHLTARRGLTLPATLPPSPWSAEARALRTETHPI